MFVFDPETTTEDAVSFKHCTSVAASSMATQAPCARIGSTVCAASPIKTVIRYADNGGGFVLFCPMRIIHYIWS